MSLTNIAGLLALGVIPLLIIIHSLKPKTKTVEISTLFLWKEVLGDEGAGFRLSWLKSNILLILQVIIVCLTALALARPVWNYETQQEGDRILILDTSASMKTKAGSATRFELARKKALQFVDDLPPGSRLLILQTGVSNYLVKDYTDDQAKLKDALHNLIPVDSPGDIEDAVYFALTFYKPDRNDQIIVITDGAGKDANSIHKIHPQLELITIPGGERNIGITKFTIRRTLSDNEQFEILLEVRNYTDSTAVCPMQLKLEDSVIEKSKIGLKPGEKKTMIFSVAQLIPGRYKAELTIDDDFPVDNTAYSVLKQSGTVSVLLISKGNYFIENLLKSFPNVQVSKMDSILHESWRDQTRLNDIVIVDGMDSPPVKEGHLLLINSFNPSIPISKVADINDPKVLSWDRNHPVTANLNLNRLMIENASAVTAGPALSRLIESQNTGLLYAYQKNRLKAVFLGFDVSRSDLPLRIAYPVLMRNIFEWLSPGKFEFAEVQTKAGEPMPLFFKADTREIAVRTPAETRASYSLNSSPFIYNETYHAGFYKVTGGEKRQYFAVNLFDEAESNILPVNKEFESTNKVLSSTGKLHLAEITLWWIVVLGVTGIIMLEWIFWLQRRTA